MGRQPQPEKGNGGFVQDRMREQQQLSDEKLWDKMGDQLPCRDPPSRFPEPPCYVNVFGGTQLERFGPNDARKARPMRQRYADHDPLQTAAEHEGDQYESHQMRNAQG